VSYLRRDQLKAGTLLRDRSSGTLFLLLSVVDALYPDYVLAYDFKKSTRVQLNAAYIHAEVLGGQHGV